MRRRELRTNEVAILRTIQQEYGPQNSIDAVFFTDANEAVMFVKKSDGQSVVMVNLTNLAAWRDDGTIPSDEELKRNWLLLK